MKRKKQRQLNKILHNKQKDNTADNRHQQSLRERVELLDKEMEVAISQGEYERAKILALEQEKLLEVLMKTTN